MENAEGVPSTKQGALVNRTSIARSDEQSLCHSSSFDTDDDICMECGAGAWETIGYQDIPGLLILCSSCDLQVHISCAGLEYVPEDDWLCKSCAE